MLSASDKVRQLKLRISSAVKTSTEDGASEDFCLNQEALCTSTFTSRVSGKSKISCFLSVPAITVLAKRKNITVEKINFIEPVLI